MTSTPIINFPVKWGVVMLQDFGKNWMKEPKHIYSLSNLREKTNFGEALKDLEELEFGHLDKIVVNYGNKKN